MQNNVCNIVFGGVGGQGILKASEICGWAALLDGHSVRKSEVHGMAQRGGSVESHLRFGRGVHSPLVARGEADYLVCFHEEEHARLATYLRKGGRDLIEYLPRAKEIITDERQLNTAIVGVLAFFLPLGEAAWLGALEKVFSPKILEGNRQIFLKARSLCG